MAVVIQESLLAFRGYVPQTSGSETVSEIGFAGSVGSVAAFVGHLRTESRVRQAYGPGRLQFAISGFSLGSGSGVQGHHDSHGHIPSYPRPNSR